MKGLRQPGNPKAGRNHRPSAAGANVFFDFVEALAYEWRPLGQTQPIPRSGTPNRLDREDPQCPIAAKTPWTD
jgi:hypothetical protein